MLSGKNAPQLCKVHVHSSDSMCAHRFRQTFQSNPPIPTFDKNRAFRNIHSHFFLCWAMRRFKCNVHFNFPPSKLLLCFDTRTTDIGQHISHSCFPTGTLTLQHACFDDACLRCCCMTCSSKLPSSQIIVTHPPSLWVRSTYTIRHWFCCPWPKNCLWRGGGIPRLYLDQIWKICVNDWEEYQFVDVHFD